MISLLPVLVTLFVALALRNVLVGLFCGVFVGVALVVDTSPMQFLPTLIRDHLVPEVADGYNASVLVLLAFIGGFVKLVERSGGGSAFARVATRWVSSRARVQIGAWFGGILIFFSDLGTPLIVGPVFQPLMDRLRVSRQKLAFILDSTSSPVAILIPFIGWGVFIMSVIADAFRASHIEMSEWDAFIAAVPYQLYAWLAISMVPALILSRHEFGPMAQAEDAAAMTAAADGHLPQAADEDAKPIFVWLPLAVLGSTLFAALAQHGFPFAQVAGADFRAGLSSAYFLAALTLCGLLIATQAKSLGDVFGDYIAGMTGMMPIAATLVLAWALGAVSETLGTGQYVADIAREGVSGELLPVVTFLLAAVISFATGSSWGTIVIMMPLAIPAAIATDASMPIVIASVLSGGLFGDHSSPVSETTILSSTGAGTTPLMHFKTQLPYALMNGFVAFIGFIVAGVAGIGWVAAAAIAAQILLLYILRALSGRVLGRVVTDQTRGNEP